MAIIRNGGSLDACLGILAIFIIISIVLITITSIGYGVEYHKESNLIENICLVIQVRAHRETCGSKDTTTTPSLYTIDYSKSMPLTSNKNLKEYYTCYLSRWTVEYNITEDTIYGNTKRAQIEGSYFRDYVDAMNELDKYPINSTQTCYTDKRSNENTAQWTKPNSKPWLISLLVGTDLLGGTLLLIGSILACAWIMTKVDLIRIGFSRQLNKPKISKMRHLKFHKMYRYADRWDIFLMITGGIAALIAGGLFPVMLYLYQNVTNHFVDLGKLQANITVGSMVNSTLNECFSLPNNNTIIQSPHDAISSIIKYYILLGFLSIFFYWIAWASWMIAGERQVRHIRYALFQNILRQEIGWFDVHNPGELSNYFVQNLDKIKDGINDKVPEFISLLARVLGALIYAFVMGWKLTLVFLSISPLIIIAFNIIFKVIATYTTKEIQAFASASSIAQEVLQNIQTVTSFHGQTKEEERFTENLNLAKKIGIQKGLYMGICQCLTQILTFVAYAITIWYGQVLFRTECQNYSAGTVLAVFIACMAAIMNTAHFIPNFQNFAEALSNGNYIFDIIDRQTKIDAMSKEGDKPEIINGDIQFDNVIFTYPTREKVPVLNKLSLKISSGKTIALVGASECGKSTIIKLIQRFYDPDEGRILLDGKDIKTLNVAWLRSHIGIVSQEPVLFTGSIEDNIRFGKSDATDEQVQSAAKMANAHDFIMTLQENYKTLSGNKLSVGQKQRVAIARALISNPKILLLDEATSALDNTSERAVQDALDKAKQGRTTIVIAHRLSTIRNADLIIGLERGQMIEYGTHDDLMEQKGLYYQLVTAQIQKEEDEEEIDPGNDKKTELVQLRSDTSTDDFDENNNDNNRKITFNDPLKNKKKCSHTPFVFKILKLNSPEWPWILLGTISSLIYGAIQPVFALFLAQIYSLTADPSAEKQERLTRFYVIGVFLIGLVSGGTQFLSTIGFAKSGEELTMRMRKLTFSAMLQQEMSYFDHEMNSVGALVTHLSSDASALKGMTGLRIGIIFQAISAIITALAIAFSSGWKLAFVIICFIPLIILTGILQGKKQNKANQEKIKGSFTEQGGQYAIQAIEHIHTVVALRQEKYFINLYENVFNQEFRQYMYRLHLIAIGAAIANSMMYFLHSASFSYGSQLVQNGEMTFGKVYRVFIVITSAMMSVGRSMAMIPDYSKAKQAALRIMELNKRQSQINPHDQSGIILKEIIGNIEFDNVDFSYPTRSTSCVLKDFSLKCSMGGTTALVGPSGSGKSTTIKLLQRFYDPLKGKVLLDGHDIKVFNIQWLRSLMGLVQQEPVLFNLSIRDNIAYGDNSRQVTQNEIEAAAKMANIHQSIISLPKGYETSCGIKGGHLSGGQKQRIAIARALIRSPKILLLDEATAALDNSNEKIVQEVLDRTRCDRICLTIAHRLSTIENSDKIAVIDQGKMKEEGTHDELLRLNGIYTKLVLAQQRF